MGNNINNIDICVVTCNRLPYLQNCIWSILASTKINYKLFVLSDNSTDGTNEWLLDMKSHNKIDEVIINDKNIGSANSLNKIIGYSTSDWFVRTDDDIYFHRGWDVACINIINEFNDCGIISFYNSIINDRGSITPINDHVYHRMATGMGGCMIKRELFDIIGGFELPDNILMGLFGFVFCKAATRVNVIRKKQYITIPEYGVQMDKNLKLQQNYLFTEYIKMRKRERTKHKKYRNR